MKCSEIGLTDVQPLTVAGENIGTLEHRDIGDRTNCLNIHYRLDAHLELPAAVDVSEQLEYPRIFVIEGVDRETFLVFGGERAYWLSTRGKVIAKLDLLRRSGEEEYWTRTIIESPGEVIIIYEAGVLVVDEKLQIRLHKPKLLNDVFVAMEGASLKFVRDHDVEWKMWLVEDLGHT